MYVNQKIIKGSTIADFLVSQVIDNYQPLNFEFLDEDLMCIFEVENIVKYGSSWRMYFDGASNALGHGIRAIFISLDGNYALH